MRAAAPKRENDPRAIPRGDNTWRSRKRPSRSAGRHQPGHLSVAIIKLESATLRVGDTIHIRGHTSDFSQRVESLQIGHAPVAEAGPQDDFGLKVTEHVRENDVVYKVK